MTICPCCGAKFEGDMRDGCDACGARSVGPPLARPAHELPSYGRGLAVITAGALLSVTFIGKTVGALFEQPTLSFRFWKVVAAAETAAWRLKWLALPLALVAVWAGARVVAQLRREPARFAGLRLAHAGLAMSACVVLAFVTLIGITVPDRLRQRELARQAAQESLAYATHRVLLQYNTRFGSLPTTPNDLTRLPDADGSVARVRALMEAGDYSPEANLAALPATTAKTRGRRGAVRLSNVSAKTNTDDGSRESLSLTNYVLVLPGPDKILNTADDLRIRDGQIVEPAATDSRTVRTRSNAKPGAAAIP